MCGMYLVFSLCGRIGRWRRGSAHGERRVREQLWMRQTCDAPHGLNSFQTKIIKVQFLSQARCVRVPRLWTNCIAQMCLVSECLVYTTRRFSGIPSRKPKSRQFIRWCGLPWAPTRLPLWVFPLRCWRWRRCRRVSPWPSVIPPSSFPIDIVIEVFSSFELLILSLTLLMFWTYRSQRLPRFRQVSVLYFKALF